MALAEFKEGRTKICLTETLPDLAARINTAHEAVARSFGNSIKHAIEAGILLVQAKEKLAHGQWLPWLKENCSIQERTAQLYMQMSKGEAQLRLKSATLADLTLEDAARQLSRSARAFRLKESEDSPLAESRTVEDTPPAEEEEQHITRQIFGAGKSEDEITDSAVELRHLTQLSIQPDWARPARDRPKGSWTVVATDADGYTYTSGARFGSKQEASAYLGGFSYGPLRDECTVIELRVIGSADEPNLSIIRATKKGPLRTLLSGDGDCHLLEWKRKQTEKIDQAD